MRRKLLILEDDEALSKLYEETFSNAGYEVVACIRFEDARASLRRQVPDVLLTDVRVGDFNGLQLAHLFRLEAPTGPIVVVSGYDDPVIRRDAEALGATFLLKPIDLPELVVRLRTE
jgi:DNA-binding response OmpR family regulator